MTSFNWGSADDVTGPQHPHIPEVFSDPTPGAGVIEDPAGGPTPEHAHRTILEVTGARVEGPRTPMAGYDAVVDKHGGIGYLKTYPAGIPSVRPTEAGDYGWGEVASDGSIIVFLGPGDSPPPWLGTGDVARWSDDSLVWWRADGTPWAARGGRMAAQWLASRQGTAEDGAEDSGNPKDAVGDLKSPLHLVPPALGIYAAKAMRNGSEKYGPYNWRERKVRAHVYYAALLRHLFAWFDGEDVAEDSGVEHLAHAAAGLAILLDALATGNLIDDRPPAGASARLIAESVVPGERAA